MSRHRNLKHMVDDSDDYDDFDPMDDDETSADYYITQIINKYKKLPREKIIKALDDTDWNINEAIKLLKSRDQPAKPGKQPVSTKAPQPVQAARPGAVPPLTGSNSVSSSLSDKPASLKPANPANPAKPAKPALSACSSVSQASSADSGKKPADPESAKKHEEARKAEEFKVTHARLNQSYPDVHPSITPSGKIEVNLVVIGHVDAGKSTLMGHLLYLLGYVDSKTISKYERDSKAIGKDSFHFAWVLDAGDEERQRGVTIDVGCGFFSTDNRAVTLLDAPGHKDFIPNMISGAAQADAAILVVDASIGEFERGFQGDGAYHGQTKEHSHVARALGISYIIVAINKLDTVSWDESRFAYIKSELETFLKHAGFKDMFFVPISGLKGDNLKERSQSTLLSWYFGRTLVELIDSIPQPSRTFTKPLRMCVMDSYKLAHGSIVGQVFSGRVEGGLLKLQDKVVISPCGVTAVVKQIEMANNLVPQAYAGESVSIALKDVTGDFGLVVPGDVVSAYAFPVPLIRRFVAKVFTFDILFPITKGLNLIMYVQSLRVSVRVASIKEQLDPLTGAVVRSHPRCLTRNMTAVVEIEADHKICLERFSSYKSLGRVLFRDRSETVMAGMVTELLE